MRASIEDVIARIADAVGKYPNQSGESNLNDYMAHIPYQVRISITDNLEDAEANYFERFGRGETVYVRLVNYDHGRQLAGNLYTKIVGAKPDMSAYTGELFKPSDRLYLFIHIDRK